MEENQEGGGASLREMTRSKGSVGPLGGDRTREDQGGVEVGESN